MDTNTNWYVYHNKKRSGPYTWQQLTEMVKTNQVVPTDLLWHAQYPQKIAADQLQGLVQLFASKQEIQDDMVTTTGELPGWEIVKSYGVVQSFVGLSYRSDGTPMIGLPSISEAYNKLIHIASQFGANAIIGFRFEFHPAGCLAYGTAVLVMEREQG